MNSEFIIYAHSNSANHGCEALVRSSCQILRNSFQPVEIDLVTDSEKIDRSYMGELCRYHELKASRRRLDFVRAYIEYKLKRDFTSLDAYPYRKITRSFRYPSIALSIGGDNYCYGNTAYYAYLNRLFRKAGHKTVLWGCSVSSEALDEKGAIEDLNSYSLITGRESLTVGLLKSAGVERVELFPDPAFTLPSDLSSIPDGFKEGNTVGINISPMIIENESVPGSTMENYRDLIRMILSETSFDIALIPHVVWKQSDDRKPLRVLFDEFKHTGRVIMIEDQNAEKLKGVISKCRFMIAARTHASIAAYSTCVPTLVVGYSIKAKGIAKDIFGSYEDYVLPVQELSDPCQLKYKFLWLMNHEKEIINHLTSIMPEYVSNAWQAGDILKRI